MTGEQEAAGRRDVRDVVVVGASAGGVEALVHFVGALPADLAAVVLVVLHVPARAPSALASILARHGPLPAHTATGDEQLTPGHILVAPPDHHLVVTEPDRASIARAPRENGHRPSIDVLFRTAAWHLGERVVAVVLSGSDDDGTAGCVAVRDRGGLVLAQSHEDALYPVMPSAAARAAGADVVASAQRLAIELGRLVGRAAGAGGNGRTVPQLRKEAGVGEGIADAVLGAPVGQPSGFVCPDCSGALFVAAEQPVWRFRCRIGHAWTADSLVSQQDVTVETALWTAVRTLQEKAELTERLALRAQEDTRPVTADRFRRAASEARDSARILQDLLSSIPLDEGEPADVAARRS
jgi:two-component system chemotaxis response regulator CheB